MEGYKPQDFSFFHRSEKLVQRHTLDENQCAMGRAAKVQSFFESAMTGFTEQLRSNQLPAAKKEFEYLNANTMTKGNVRVFFPVGMGGFSFERMDETTVVYDCGSTSKKVINDNIKSLKSGFFGLKDRVIDHLFISHFDVSIR